MISTGWKWPKLIKINIFRVIIFLVQEMIKWIIALITCKILISNIRIKLIMMLNLYIKLTVILVNLLVQWMSCSADQFRCIHSSTWSFWLYCIGISKCVHHSVWNWWFIYFIFDHIHFFFLNLFNVLYFKRRSLDLQLY